MKPPPLIIIVDRCLKTVIPIFEVVPYLQGFGDGGRKECCSCH